MKRVLGLGAAILTLAACSQQTPAENQDGLPDLAAISAAAGLPDNSDGDNWPAYGRTYGEQHFSPLTDINHENVADLGLAWFYDLPPGNPMSGPLVVDGVLYTATGYSIVRAFDATDGKLLWTYDPKAPEMSGQKLRQGWGIRGLAYWNGKVIVGTQDGRLLGIDAKTGQKLWSAMTVEKDDLRFISGPPRVFDGKVIIGHGGADTAPTRGYVTTYDADTGEELWRFYVVPGNPADGFEDETQEMAAKTWAGEWWKYGGGGTVWNTFTYDPDTSTIYIGTGNGSPWSHKLRSDSKGDNLFLASVVALDANSGAYKWHYQFNPGESWDYNASMDMQLADITINGEERKVLMELPKNGFFYVIDRLTGELLSAEAVTEVSWATGIDLKTGRPKEVPGARFPGDKPFTMLPGPTGAHTWLPSAFSPKTGLIYLPVTESSVSYFPLDYGPDWKYPSNNTSGAGYDLGFVGDPAKRKSASRLVAWDPVAQKERWRVVTPGNWTGGVLATAGQLVFQGDLSGNFRAFDAVAGKALWSFNAQVPVLAPPITYRVKGVQYVTVLSGLGTSAALLAQGTPDRVDYHSQPRRILTFALNGKQTIPAYTPPPLTPPADPNYKPDAEAYKRGEITFLLHCGVCHGLGLRSMGGAPDLRESAVPAHEDTFKAIVKDGGLVANAMPAFAELDDRALNDLRSYIRGVQAELRTASAQSGE